MRFRLSIRDLLWLTLVVGLAVGWWLDHRRLDGMIYMLHVDDKFDLSAGRKP